MAHFYDFTHFSPEEIIEYLRKSRSDDPLLTVEEVLARHETILKEWCEQNIGSPIPEGNVYREVVSGETIKDRPEFQEVLKKIESPKIKAILVVEVQRLSRGDLEDAGRLIKLLRYTNTLVITPQKTYDLRDEYDREAFERELKRGNEFLEYQKKIMNRGRLLSVSQGNFIGNTAPYGYDKDTIIEGKRKCPTLKINEKEAEAVRVMFDLYVNQNMGMTNIAKSLNQMGYKPRKVEQWSTSAIKDMLANIHYMGKVRWNWRKTINIVEDGEISQSRPKTKVGEYLVYDGKHPAIISEELWNAAQNVKSRKPRVKKVAKIRNPLAGLVYCECGRAMSLRTYKNNGIERAEARLLCDNQSFCGIASCLYSEMEEKVCEILRNCIADFELRIKEDDRTSEKLHENLIKRLETRLQELNKKEESQWEKYTEEGMPKHIFDNLNEKVLKEKEEVEQALCKAYESKPEHIDYAEKLFRFKDALEAFQNPNVDVAKKNTLLKNCIERIDYKRGKSIRLTKVQATKMGIPFKQGGNWYTPPMELDVKLNI